MTSKFALVIANTEYQDASFAKLTAPGKDAEEFAHVLREPELAAFDDVQVLLNEGESKIRRSIARFFVDRKRDDLLLLYFSGHGIRNDQGQLFLASNDTEIKILEASGIPADFVTQSMNNSRSQRQLLILDCCNSGAFAHGSKSASGVGKSMGIATAFEGSGFGRVVLTATDATQYAWEGDKVIGDTQKSVFTHFLIEGLKGDADHDGDGRIDVDELYDYAYEEVARRTPKQTPGKWSYKQQGDIILRENLKPRDVKPVPLPSELLEILSHPNSGVRRAAIQDLISLLDGKHLGLVRAAQEKLREIAENDDSLTLRRTAEDTLSARGLMLEQPVLPPIEILREKQREEKHALSKVEGNIEKPIAVPQREIHAPRVDRLREKTRSVLPDWKSLASRFDLRVILGIGALLVVVSLGIAVFPALKNMIAPGIVSTMKGKDGMTLLYVPVGEFTMGSDSGDSNQKPIHTVHLDAFWIDKTEVTNKMYLLCVEAGVCNEPTSKRSYTHSSYYGNAEYDNYPVIYVDWNMAKTYCEWAERRLPTEAEWEKAARGTDGNVYPWGNEAPNNNLLNYNGAVGGDTTEVDTYPDGKSMYRAMNMAGNVWEWVADWYSETYYASSPTSNPSGPDSGQYRVFRGGSWYAIDTVVRSAYRNQNNPTYTNGDVGFRCAKSQNQQPGSTPLVQARATTETSQAIQTSQPTKTDTPSPTETSIPPTPTRDIGSTMISDKDGMTFLYVPAGEFTMGSDNGKADAKPVHEVYLDAFWIDQTEVTNAMYAKCIQDGKCNQPSDTTRYDDSNYANHPVVFVSWNDAKTYCGWADRRLPTEAEWEKAARGENAFTYPWGNDAPNNNLLNYNSAVGDTTEVGKYPDGKSIYGALEMAGNVWEWVADWYDSRYYQNSPSSNPQGPSSGQYREVRGGSWGDYVYTVHSAFRGWGDPTVTNHFVGFRCSLSADEQAESGTSQPSATEAITPTTLSIGSTMEGNDGMTLLYVPAGEFTMGSDTYLNARPIHQVNLDAFWIDQTEVTNKMYTSCVEAGVCTEPTNKRSYTHTSYYGNAEYDHYPVIYVDWNMAKAYCEWAERRLPTEAEWEKAARGDDARTYPWGNDAPNNNLLNYNSAVGDTTEIGSYPDGKSAYGALDMAGNVWEWVNDWYSDTYYTGSPTSNPLGPASGKYRVLRGGTWYYDNYNVPSALRSGNYPANADVYIGFRCSRSP